MRRRDPQAGAAGTLRLSPSGPGCHGQDARSHYSLWISPLLQLWPGWVVARIFCLCLLLRNPWKNLLIAFMFTLLRVFTEWQQMGPRGKITEHEPWPLFYQFSPPQLPALFCLISCSDYKYGGPVAKISNNAETYKVESEFPLKFAPRALPPRIYTMHSLT